MWRLPLSTELIHRHLVRSSGYFSGGYQRLDRLHVILMTNLKANGTSNTFHEVIVVFENDYSNILKCDSKSETEVDP